MAGGIGSLHLSNGLAAGAAGREYLRQEGPESEPLREEAAATVGAPFGWLEESCGNPRRAECAELG